MYRPKQFDMPDVAEMQDLIADHGFAVLVSAAGAEGMMATHLPLYLADRAGNGVLWGHVTKANDHWRAFDGKTRAMAVFQGPHGYISPDWYDTAKSVPTWNYLAVHAYGRPRVMDDPAKIVARLSSLSDQYEAGRETPWRMAALPDDFVAAQLKGIVAFEMPIQRLEGKRKMSQNRQPEDVAGAVRGLRASDRPEDAVLAELTERANKHRLG